MDSNTQYRPLGVPGTIVYHSSENITQKKRVLDLARGLLNGKYVKALNPKTRKADHFELSNKDRQDGDLYHTT